MPSAILNYLVGSIYSPKRKVDNIASMIVVSTLLSFITVPIVVFLALKYFRRKFMSNKKDMSDMTASEISYRKFLKNKLNL